MNVFFISAAPRGHFARLLSIALSFALAVGTSLTAQAHDPTPPATTSPAQSPPAATTETPAQPSVSPASTKEERLVSLVLLLSSPRKPSHELIAHAVSEGLGTKISNDAVITKPPYHQVTVGADTFIINDIAAPYFEKTAEVADEIKNPNLSRAVREHRAWISVDWVSTEKQADVRNVYQMIGKMVAHLSAKDTLAVYSPDMDQFVLWAPTVRQGLEGEDPLGVFEPAADRSAPAQTTASPSVTPEQR